MYQIIPEMKWLLKWLDLSIAIRKILIFQSNKRWNNMSINSSCIDEIDDFITTKINFEFARHEKEEHEMRQEHLPELGRDVQVARGTLHRCLSDLTRKEKR